MYVVKKRDPKREVEILLDKLSPEILKAFSEPPEFGSVSVKIVYHEGKPTRIECGKCINQKV